MGLSREVFAELIPHTGAMCLLDEVLEWDDDRIVCRSASHRLADNPLRRRDRLHALCGVEYAAQAMAIHGALKVPPGGKPTRGFLGSVRGLTLAADRLDDIADDLRVEATRLMGDGASLVYEFQVAAAGRTLLSGRASVFLVPV